jgi:hypothetical protein
LEWGDLSPLSPTAGKGSQPPFSRTATMLADREKIENRLKSTHSKEPPRFPPPDGSIPTHSTFQFPDESLTMSDENTDKPDT